MVWPPPRYSASAYRKKTPRVLEITGDALPAWQGEPLFTVSRVSGTEKLGELFDYTVELATLDDPGLGVNEAQALVEIDSLVGAVVDIRIATEDSDKNILNPRADGRTITGLIASAQCMGVDERRAFYQFRVRPLLWRACLRRDSRTFMSVSVKEITESILRQYRCVFEMRLSGPGFGHKVYPLRDYQRMFWESDFGFLNRLWQEWGITFYYEGGTLVLCDSTGAYHPHPLAYETLRYLAPEDQRIDEEHVRRFRIARTLTTGRVSVSDFDYTRAQTYLGAQKADPRERSFDNAEEYAWGDYAQPLAGTGREADTPNDAQFEGEHLARVKLEAHRAKSLRAKGRGNLRGLRVGRTFHLEGYPQAPGNGEYLVTATKLDIRNNDTATQTPGANAHYRCKTKFTAQPANTMFRTPQKAKKPRSHGEIARVVGHGDAPVWTDRLGRVLVRFVWDRDQKPLPLAQQASDWSHEGRSNGNSTCWVRAASPWQGSQYGAIYVPRVGHEVVIGYHDDDPDRPYIAGRHVNQSNLPPWKLPANAALSGWRSQDLEGGAANSVVTDDTPGKLQTQVASDHAQSRLVLGYNTRIDGHEGRQQARGEGFELATDAHGVARANRGLLITTETREGASSPAMDMGETVQRLVQSHQQQDVLAHTAVQAQALEQSDRQALSQSLKALNDETADTTRAFPGPAKPHLLLASHADIAQTAARHVHLHSGEHTTMTTGGHLGASTGGSLLAAARRAIRLFAYQLGIRIVSYAEDIDIRALKKNLNLLAKLDITQTANRITIRATQELMLHGGDSYISLKPGKITVGGMVYEVDAAMQGMPPRPIGVNPVGLPDVQANNAVFEALAPTGKPLPGADYRLDGASDGHVFNTSAKGESPLVHTAEQQALKFALHWDDFTDTQKPA